MRHHLLVLRGLTEVKATIVRVVPVRSQRKPRHAKKRNARNLHESKEGTNMTDDERAAITDAVNKAAAKISIEEQEAKIAVLETAVKEQRELAERHRQNHSDAVRAHADAEFKLDEFKDAVLALQQQIVSFNDRVERHARNATRLEKENDALKLQLSTTKALLTQARAHIMDIAIDFDDDGKELIKAIDKVLA